MRNFLPSQGKVLRKRKPPETHLHWFCTNVIPLIISILIAAICRYIEVR